MNLSAGLSLPAPRPLPPHLTPPARRLVRLQLPHVPTPEIAELTEDTSPLVAAILAYAEGTAHSRR